MTGTFNRRLILLAAILFIAAIPYFTRLGASSLWDANEAFYTETPREMIESGDYINPSFNYQPRFNKPPLSYWIAALFYKLFGVSATAERLAMGLAAMTMIATAFALGRLLFSVEAGLYAGIALAIAPRFLMFSRRIMIDVYMAMFMAAILLLFALAEARPTHRRRYLILMYVTVGLAVMTKGPVAVALPAIVLLVYFTLQRELRRLRETMLPLGALIVAIIILPWYIAIYAQHGWQYIATFILKDNLSRYTQPVWGPRRSVFFYVPVILGDIFPWSLFFITALFTAVSRWVGISNWWQRFRRKGSLSAKPDDADNETIAADEAKDTQLRVQRLCLIWVAVIVVFFSLSRNKEDLYILPIYPAVAALIGAFLARATQTETTGSYVRWARWVSALLGTVITVVGVGLLYVFGHSSSDYQFDGARTLGLMAASGGLLALALALSRKQRLAVLAIAVTMVALNSVFTWRTLPDFERFKPVRPLCEVIRTDAPADALVGYYRYAAPSMVFYLRRQVFEYYQPEELLNAFTSGRPVYCLLRDEEYDVIKSLLPPQTSVLASYPLFQVKLKIILEKQAPPQLLLITNKGGVEFAQ